MQRSWGESQPLELSPATPSPKGSAQAWGTWEGDSGYTKPLDFFPVGLCGPRVQEMYKIH